MSDTLARAEQIKDTHRNWSFAAGIVPIPLVDIAAVAALQLRMLGQLSRHYGQEFTENRGKNYVAALLGGILPTKLAMGSVGTWLKCLPVVGPVVGALATPAFAAAATHAVGRVFIQHYESGGTFLDFDPAAAAGEMQEEYEKGKKS